MRQLTALALIFLMSLTAAGAVEGEAAVCRGAFVTALWEGFGGVPFDVNGPFVDVAPQDPWADAVAWCAAEGIVQGVGDDRFAPERAITREEAALLLRRMAGRMGRSTFLPDGLAECNDYEDISPWADDSLYWATDVDLIPWAEGGRLDPTGTFTQEEAREIVSRFFHGMP